MAINREALVDNANLAEQGERYDDMLDFMFQCAEFKEPFSLWEATLFHKATRQAVESRRVSLKRINESEEEAASEGDNERISELNEEKIQIQSELTDVAVKILDTLASYIIPNSDSEFLKALFRSIEGDNFKVMCELTEGEVRDKYLKKADVAYSDSIHLFEEFSEPDCPLRLRAAVNYSIFLYETADQQTQAIDIAQKAFDDSIVNVDSRLSSDEMKESAELMLQLDDKIMRWSESVHG